MNNEDRRKVIGAITIPEGISDSQRQVIAKELRKFDFGGDVIVLTDGMTYQPISPPTTVYILTTSHTNGDCRRIVGVFRDQPTAKIAAHDAASSISDCTIENRLGTTGEITAGPYRWKIETHDINGGEE